MSESFLKRIELHHRDGKHYWYYFLCICGKKVINRIDTRKKSCGCKRKEFNSHYIDGAGYLVTHILRDNKRVRVREHRRLMEDFLGRKLRKEEHVHHINHIKTDNRLENLMVVSISDHNKLDNGWEKIDNEWWKNCPRCKRFMKIEGNFHKCKNQYFFICKSCSVETNNEWKEKRRRKLHSCTTAEAIRALDG